MSLLMASRIHGDMYVRFRGRHGETYRRKAARRPMPSLQTNLQEARPELWQKLERENSRPAIEEDREERRVGKECRIGCRSRWSPYH